MAEVEKTTATNDVPIKTEKPHSSADQRPRLGPDRGQDDVYATESDPEGLRYGEKAPRPGELPHAPVREEAGQDHEPIISVDNP